MITKAVARPRGESRVVAWPTQYVHGLSPRLHIYRTDAKKTNKSGWRFGVVLTNNYLIVVALVTMSVHPSAEDGGSDEEYEYDDDDDDDGDEGEGLLNTRPSIAEKVEVRVFEYESSNNDDDAAADAE